MSKFSEENFIKILCCIESMEIKNENIWVPIGILEKMYDDDIGYIDQYFHTSLSTRDRKKLWLNLNKNFDK